MPFMTEDFANEAFPTIALVGLADSFGNDQSEPRNVLAVEHTIDNEHLVARRLFPLKHAVEFAPFSQSHVFGKPKVCLEVFAAFGHGLFLINPDFRRGIGAAAQVVFIRQLQQLEIEPIIRLNDENRILRRMFI